MTKRSSNECAKTRSRDLVEEIRAALCNEELIGSDAESVYRGLLDDVMLLLGCGCLKCSADRRRK